MASSVTSTSGYSPQIWVAELQFDGLQRHEAVQGLQTFREVYGRQALIDAQPHLGDRRVVRQLIRALADPAKV